MSGNIIKIKDSHAIDLMAYSKSVAIICPLCSGRKSSWDYVCNNCFGKFGNEGKRIVMMELGRYKWGLWYDFTGLNLRGNGSQQKNKKVRKVIQKISTLSHNLDVDSVDPVIEKNVSDEEVVDEAVTAVLEQFFGVENTSVVDEKHILKEEKTLEVLDDAEVYEIGGGIKVFRDVMKTLAFGGFHERIECPICRDRKYGAKWMCHKCFRELGSKGSRIIKREVSRINPGKMFRQPLSREEFQLLVQKAYKLISSDVEEFVCRDSRSLALTLQSLRGISRNIPTSVLNKAAGEAITMERKKSEQKKCYEIVKAHWDAEMFKKMINEEVAEFLFLVKKINYSFENVAWAVNKIMKEAEKELSQFSLDKIKRNLKENARIAEDFRNFLVDYFKKWKEQRKLEGETATMDVFASEIGTSYQTFYNFKSAPLKKGLSKKMALKILQNVNLGLPN